MLNTIFNTLVYIKIITPVKIKRASQPPHGSLVPPLGGSGPPVWNHWSRASLTCFLYCLLTMSNVSIDFSVACHFNAFELAFNEKSMTLFIHLHHECRPGMFCGIHTQRALLSFGVAWSTQNQFVEFLWNDDTELFVPLDWKWTFSKRVPTPVYCCNYTCSIGSQNCPSADGHTSLIEL